jgi:hypothetical protein
MTFLSLIAIKFINFDRINFVQIGLLTTVEGLVQNFYVKSTFELTTEVSSLTSNGSWTTQINFQRLFSVESLLPSSTLAYYDWVNPENILLQDAERQLLTLENELVSRQKTSFFVTDAAGWSVCAWQAVSVWHNICKLSRVGAYHRDDLKEALPG